MSTLRLDQFASTPLTTQPFEYLVVRDFLTPEALDAARRDYPQVPSAGSHPPSGLKIEGGFKAVIDDFYGPAFQQAVEQKFNIDLSGRPLMYTVRGHCRARDGQIHTDTKSKIITVLLYMNDSHWNSEAGRLRLLRDGSNLDNFIEEIEPAGGTLLVFKRADNSWH
ncbi:MAG: 2OG-Fe(II) oxygenase, partial [Inhella sp.]